MYLVRQAWAKGVDLDEMLQNAVSHQGLHLFATHPAILDTSLVIVLVQILDKVW